MARRESCRAGTFYPGNVAGIEAAIAEFESGVAPSASDRARGGMVPHAGWVYSGSVAYALLKRLASGRPRRCVLLGAVHVPGIRRPACGPWPEWEVPSATLGVDTGFVGALQETGTVELNRRAHLGEHSIEVQLPLVAALLPGVRIVPIAVPPTSEALELGRRLGELLVADGETSVVVASSDLTHYGEDYYGFAPAGAGPGAVAWAQANDSRFLARVCALDAEGALREARTHHNACGAGAVAATIECVRRLGAIRGEVMEHTSSLRASGEQGARNFVGYASVAFV